VFAEDQSLNATHGQQLREHNICLPVDTDQVELRLGRSLAAYHRRPASIWLAVHDHKAHLMGGLDHPPLPVIFSCPQFAGTNQCRRSNSVKTQPSFLMLIVPDQVTSVVNLLLLPRNYLGATPSY
jgi:hypothetical protein